MSISIDYISKENFENQPRKIQEILEDYFVGAFGLYQDTDGTIKHGYWTKDRVRLLTEGQLRKFIEDKTGLLLEVQNFGKSGYCIHLNDGEWVEKQFNNLGNNLIQAYWKVALEVIKELLNILF